MPTHPKDFIHYLDERLRHPLPGRAAHVRMAPKTADGFQRPPNLDPPQNARKSGVLAAFFERPEDGELSLILTLRTSKLKQHGGQLSFPGGGLDAGETWEQAALREAHEEVNLAPEHVAVVGHSSQLYIPPSNNIVQPVMAWVDALPPLVAEPSEVEEVIELPFCNLLDSCNLKQMPRTIRGHEFQVPYWDIHTVPLWGATSMILSEIVHLHEEFVEEYG